MMLDDIDSSGEDEHSRDSGGGERDAVAADALLDGDRSARRLCGKRHGGDEQARESECFPHFLSVTGRYSRRP